MQFNLLTHQRRGLTLIEMLIGMAITLVMMAAVVQLFANISQGVRNRRATMEVSAKLRTARAQLYNDLAGATCLKYPKDTHAVMPKPDSNNMPDGYFEIVEGQRSDESPYAPGSFDPATSMIPSTGQLYDADGQPLDPNRVTDGGGLGDYDDILAMTVESQTERFRGRGRGLRPGGNPLNYGTFPDFTDGDWIDMAISSPVAEVVWFATQNPADRSEGEPGMRKVYRRVVLITPWYGTVTNSYGTGGDPRLDLNRPQYTGSTPEETRRLQLAELQRFQEKYDISVRLENGHLVPNTLADLARREHRFAHSPNSNTAPPNFAYYPHQFPYNILASNNFLPANAGNASLHTLEGDREGEDLILDEVLAFDVQVYDPGAPLYYHLDTLLDASSSQSFVEAVARLKSAPAGPTQVTGFGGYVDLGWNDLRDLYVLGQRIDSKYNNVLYLYDYTTITGAPTPLFQQERRLGWHPAFPDLVRGSSGGIPSVYDTWTTHYETDQTNQEQSPFYTIANADPSLASAITWNPWQIGTPDGSGGYIGGIDQGTNGLDENAINGPDDPLERETSPPYPYPLYGVQVKLRLYEPDSRQIRETTVTRNLAK